MKHVLLYLLAALALLFGQASHAAWNADWPQRIRINLNTADDGLALKAAADALPLLVRLHSGNFNFASAKPDGSDLRFVAADDKTPLKYHIEKFDSVNELALVWVALPRLAPNSKTEFVWLYYGNPKAAPADEPKGSYDAAQALVWHFGDRETLPQDSTANANHALRSSARLGGPGLIDGGASFDGKGEIGLKATPSLKPGAGGFTVSMWVKPAVLPQTATLFSQREGNSGISLLLRGDRLVAQAGATQTPPAGPLVAATWQHVALVVQDGLTLYLNGQEIAHVAGPTPAPGGDIVVGSAYAGDLDDFGIASVARSGAWIKAVAGSAGQDQRLVSYQAVEGAEEAAGPSYLRILFSALTVDGWVVVGILGVMFVISVVVMASKTVLVNRTARANRKFMAQFARLLDGTRPMSPVADGEDDDEDEEDEQVLRPHARSSLFRLYTAGNEELQHRFDKQAAAGREPSLSAQAIEAIRAAINARLVRELQRLNGQMVLLTIAIAGGPFLGLLGTVVGVMITFAAIAAAGDVNVNAIAPGIAAALIATVAGLTVAIPALFGYNYLTSRIKDLTSDMQVFIDEFIARIAEKYSV